MKCLIYKGNVTGPHILVSFPRPLSLSLRQQSSLLQHQTTPLKSPPHYSTATGPSKSAKTSWQAPRPLPCSPSLTSVQCLTCGSFLLDTLPSLCFPRHQLLLVLSTSDNFRVGGGWWWWQEHFVLSFNNPFFFFLSILNYSLIHWCSGLCSRFFSCNILFPGDLVHFYSTQRRLSSPEFSLGLCIPTSNFPLGVCTRTANR